MAFADLKNDFVFRRLFATHPDILRGLLNDLLERPYAQAIEQIEYLPSEQLPQAEGAKLSILDVRCKDRAGTMTERRSKNHGLLQVQYAFLELPKMPARRPD